MRKLNVNDDPELEEENHLFEDADENNKSVYDYHDSEVNVKLDGEIQSQQNSKYNLFKKDDEYRRYEKIDSDRRDSKNEYRDRYVNDRKWDCATTKYRNRKAKKNLNSFRRKSTNPYRSSSNSGQAVFYLLFFIALAVLFKWVILKNTGMTAVALFIIIIVVVGHLRDK